MYRWYSNLVAGIKLTRKFSSMFEVTKGTRQGSVFELILFNICIDDLLQELYAMSDKVYIGDYSFNVFAYANDVIGLCTSVHESQRLIHKHADYALR